MNELNDVDGAAEPYAAPWPPEAVRTGDPEVDAALAHLQDLPETPVAEHGGVYADLHDALMAALDAEVA
ncbi:hypothetical protein [Arthrobacter sp. NyZ413]|uniref:hypothetical protein n=1 Tax=Arthrobacter sp. NyZ413 TaxID=3144669 RepID=UPI002BBC1C92|nr:hypothetical protein [Arthrobacter sp.]